VNAETAFTNSSLRHTRVESHAKPTPFTSALAAGKLVSLDDKDARQTKQKPLPDPDHGTIEARARS
jgi:hypothetical protein